MSIRAQVWSLDLMIAVSVIAVAMIIFFTYSSDLSKVDENKQELLVSDAQAISGFLVGEGIPADWDEVNVTAIGLANKNKVMNASKVAEFSSMVQSNYSKVKKLLSSSSDFYIFFEDKNNNPVNIEGVDGVGASGVNQSSVREIKNPRNIITVERFVAYNNDLIRMGVIVW